MTKKAQKTKTLATETWVNQKTGEVKQFTVVEKGTGGTDRNWWKLWVTDLLSTLGLIGNTKIKVLMHILDNINPYDNIFSGTVREIAKESKTSPATVQRVLNILTNEADFLVKVRVAQYQVNPNIIAKGTSNKRRGLMVKYEKSKIKDSDQLEGQRAMDFF